MIMKLFVILIIILLINFIFFKPEKIEGASFLLDTLRFPENPYTIDESQIKGGIRLIGVKRHLKMDKGGRIEYISYDPPKPELGEKKCYRIKCLPIYKDVACWICV